MISARQLLEEIGISVDDLPAIKAAPQHLLFELDNRCKVHLESTAHNIIDAITRLPLEAQHKFVASLLKRVPKPGDSDTINDDTGTQARNYRSSGRVTHIHRQVTDEPDVIHLILTR